MREPVHREVLGPESLDAIGRGGGSLCQIPPAPVARFLYLSAKLGTIAQVVVRVLEHRTRRGGVPQRALVPVTEQTRAVQTRTKRIRILRVEDEIQSLNSFRDRRVPLPRDGVRLAVRIVPSHEAGLPRELPVLLEVPRHRAHVRVCVIGVCVIRRVEPFIRRFGLELGIVEEIQRRALRRADRELGGGRPDEVFRLVRRRRDPVERGTRQRGLARGSVERGRGGFGHGSSVRRVGPRARWARWEHACIVRIEPRRASIVRRVLVPIAERGGASERRVRALGRGGRAGSMGRSRASVERVRTLALDGARAELRGQAELIHRPGIVRAGAVIRSGKETCGDGGGQSVGSRSRGCCVLDLFVVRCRGARWGGWTRGDDAISRDSTRSSPFGPLHAMNGIARCPDATPGPP